MFYVELICLSVCLQNNVEGYGLLGRNFQEMLIIVGGTDDLILVGTKITAWV